MCMWCVHACRLYEYTCIHSSMLNATRRLTACVVVIMYTCNEHVVAPNVHKEYGLVTSMRHVTDEDTHVTHTRSNVTVERDTHTRSNVTHTRSKATRPVCYLRLSNRQSIHANIYTSYVCMYVRMFVCVCIYTNTLTHRHTNSVCSSNPTPATLGMNMQTCVHVHIIVHRHHIARLYFPSDVFTLTIVTDRHIHSGKYIHMRARLNTVGAALPKLPPSKNADTSFLPQTCFHNLLGGRLSLARPSCWGARLRDPLALSFGTATEGHTRSCINGSSNVDKHMPGLVVAACEESLFPNALRKQRLYRHEIGDVCEEVLHTEHVSMHTFKHEQISLRRCLWDPRERVCVRVCERVSDSEVRVSEREGRRCDDAHARNHNLTRNSKFETRKHSLQSKLDCMRLIAALAVPACSIRRLLDQALARSGACSIRRLLDQALARSGACSIRRWIKLLV